MATKAMKTTLLGGEEIIKQSAANMQKGLETVGGRLFLTNKRLIFESHKFNIQAGANITILKHIGYVEKAWTKLLGLIPVFPNSIVVQIENSKDKSFTLNGRNDWIEQITTTKNMNKR